MALAEVTGFDLDARTVTALAADGEPFELPYDSLIVAAGAGQSYFGHDEFSRWAPGMKTIDDALELRAGSSARSRWPRWSRTRTGGGAGSPSSSSAAGRRASRSRGRSPSWPTARSQANFHTIDSTSARVILFDGGKEILAGFGDKLSAKAAKELERQGVEIHTDSIVTAVDRHGVEVKGADGEVTRIEAQTKSGPPASRHPRSPRCSPTSAASSATGPGGYRCARTAPSPGIRRSSRSAT